MDKRSAVRSVWRDMRAGLARLNALIADHSADDDAVFVAPPRTSERRDRADDAERRIAEARNARLGDSGVRRPM